MKQIVFITVAAMTACSFMPLQSQTTAPVRKIEQVDFLMSSDPRQLLVATAFDRHTFSNASCMHRPDREQDRSHAQLRMLPNMREKNIPASISTIPMSIKLWRNCLQPRQPSWRSPRKEGRRMDRRFAAAQQPDGYINTYFTLTGLDQRWTDMGKHEMYCAGPHDRSRRGPYKTATGKRKLLDVCIRMVDHMMNTFDRANAIGYRDMRRSNWH